MVITSCSFAFLHSTHIYKLNASFQCRPQHSYSAILAISDFLLKNFPEIMPPLNVQQILFHIKDYYNPLIEQWNDYLLELTVNQMALRYQDCFFILIPVDQEQVQKIKGNHLLTQIQNQWKEYKNQQKVAHIFSIPLYIKKQKKIGIYLTHPIYQPKHYPRINMSPIFMGILFNNQKWQNFDIPKGQIPSVSQLQTFDSIIITGSQYSVLQQSQQISLALERLMLAYNNSNKLKIVGVCYGHQLLSLHFGAQVVKKNMKSSLQSVEFDSKIVQKYSFLQLIQNHLPLKLIQLHQDNVETVPQNFQHLGWSQSCKVESLISKDGRILTTQFHSELLYNYCENMQKCLNKYGDTLKFKTEENQQIIDKSNNDSAIFLQVISKFIDS